MGVENTFIEIQLKIEPNNYYPFGMLMPRRHGSVDGYRYGFNGKEKDDEIKGEGAHYDYGFRIYDPRLGRFLSTDPLFAGYPYYTPYQFAGNNPIWATDLDGLEQLITNQTRRVQNYTIVNEYNEPIQGVVDVVYWKEGSIVREQRESGTYVLKEGYDGGPQLIEDIKLKRQAKYAPEMEGRGGKYRRMFRYTNTITPINATKPPPEPPYVPIVFQKEEVEPKLKTSDKKSVKKSAPIIKTGSATALVQGYFYPTIDSDGIDFVDPGTGDFPAQSRLQSIVDGLNNSPNIDTVVLSGSLSHGSAVSDFKVRNAVIMGLNKLQTLMKSMGLRDGINFEVKINDVKAPNTSKGDEGAAQLDFKFLDKSQ